MDGLGVGVDACRGPGQQLVRFVLLVHQAVVGILGEGRRDAQRRLVLPHEVVGADHVRRAQQQLLEDGEAERPVRLGRHALAGAVLARQTGVEGREAPRGDDHGPLHALVPALQVLLEAIRQHALFQIHRAVAVDGEDVAVLPGDVEDVRYLAGETAAEDHVVGIGSADGGGGDAEIAFRHQAQEGALVGLGGGRPGGRRLHQRRQVVERRECGAPGLVEGGDAGMAAAQQLHQGLLGGVAGGLGPRIAQDAGAGVGMPLQLVVDEVADDPGIVLHDRAAFARLFGAERRPLGAEDVGEAGPGGARGDGIDGGEIRAEAEEFRMGHAAPGQRP